MIYTDDVHLISDSNLAELHMFARTIGADRSKFQDHPKHPNYMIFQYPNHKRKRTLLDRTLEKGGKRVPPKELVKLVRFCKRDLFEDCNTFLLKHETTHYGSCCDPDFDYVDLEVTDLEDFVLHCFKRMGSYGDVV